MYPGMVEKSWLCLENAVMNLKRNSTSQPWWGSQPPHPMCLCLCWGCSSVIEFSPSVCKVLGSILSNPARQSQKSVYLFCLCNHRTEQERSAISSKKLSRIFPDKNVITFLGGYSEYVYMTPRLSAYGGLGSQASVCFVQP